MSASQPWRLAQAVEEGLEHDDPLGAGHPAVLVPPRDRIPGDPHRTPVTTRRTARVGGGSDTRALDARENLRQTAYRGQCIYEPTSFDRERAARESAATWSAREDSPCGSGGLKTQYDQIARRPKNVFSLDQWT
jgi:hypothetical protein